MGAEIKTIKKGLLLGIGFVIPIVFLGFVSALFAVTLNTFASGDLVRAAEINANFTALKDEIVNAAPDNVMTIGGTHHGRHQLQFTGQSIKQAHTTPIARLGYALHA